MDTVAPSTLAALRDRYVEQLIAGEAREAQRIVAKALHLAPAAAVYHGLLSEALYEVGRRWELGAVTVAEEHLATGISETVLPQVAFHLPRAPRQRRTAIVACVPGELHAIGSRVVGDFLEAAGWDVLCLGALTPPGALCELVVARNAQAVALSAAMPERLDEVDAVLAELETLPRPPFVAVGGQAFASVGTTSSVRGEAVFVRTPEALVSALAQRFPEEPLAAAG
jgi:MerR family transcriptional regulator, light-induced transcriptional regulator